MRNQRSDPETHVQEGHVIGPRSLHDPPTPAKACLQQERRRADAAAETWLVQARSIMIVNLVSDDQSRLAAPQLVLPLAAFQLPAAVLALVHDGAAVLLSVGAAAAFP